MENSSLHSPCRPSLDCTAYDVAGNAATAQETVRIDGTPPVIDDYLVGGTAGSNGWFMSGPVSLTCDATDATSGVAGVSYGVQTATGDGTTTVDCSAIDNAGNSSTASENVRIDSQPPSVSLSPSTAGLGSPITIVSSDGGSGLDYGRMTISGNGITPRIIDLPYLSGSDSVTWDGFDGAGDEAPYGTYAVTVEIWDAAGNAGSATGAWTRSAPWDQPSDTPRPTRTRTPSPSSTPTNSPTSTNTVEGAVPASGSSGESGLTAAKTQAGEQVASSTITANTATPFGGIPLLPGTPTGEASNLLPFLMMLGAGAATTAAGKYIQSKQKGVASPAPTDVSLGRDIAATVLESRVVMEPKVVETLVPHMVEEKQTIVEKITHSSVITKSVQVAQTTMKWVNEKSPAIGSAIERINKSVFKPAVEYVAKPVTELSTWVEEKSRVITKTVQKGWDVVKTTVMVPVVKSMQIGSNNFATAISQNKLQVMIRSSGPDLLSKSLVYGGRTLSVLAVMGMLSGCWDFWKVLGINPPATQTATVTSTRTITRTYTRTSTRTRTKTPTITNTKTATITMTPTITRTAMEILSAYGISYIGNWTSSQKDAMLRAAALFGNKIRQSNETNADAFRQVFGWIEFIWCAPGDKNGVCGYYTQGGFAADAHHLYFWTISTNSEHMVKNIIHEFGHLFQYNYGSGNMPSFDRAKILRPGDYDWQQHPCSVYPDSCGGGELLSDMFIAWVYDAWNTNPQYIKDVKEAKEWMNHYVLSSN